VRIARDGGAARVYRLPGLDALEWKAEGRMPPLDSLVGTSDDLALVFFRDRRGNLAAIDLEGRRVRTYAGGVSAAAVGADGALYAVDTAGVAMNFSRRTPERFRSRFPRVPERLFAALGGGVIGLNTTAGRLSVLGPRDTLRGYAVAAGPMTVTSWGDLVAVAADSALVVYDPAGRAEPRSVRFRAGAQAVAFSPSGHQIYVGQGDGVLAVMDRFGLEVLRRIELPGVARDVRAGPMGRWLLARPMTNDSIWIIDLETSTVRAAGGTWSDDLPTVGVPDFLVSREGDDVVARDLSSEALAEHGRVAGGARDAWAVVRWPRPEATDGDGSAASLDVLPGDSSAATAAADSAGGRERLFLQVSSSRNPDWARELSAKLVEAGLPSSVLPPQREGEAYRVVLGPYASREEAERSGRSLGMPYFVIGADSVAR